MKISPYTIANFSTLSHPKINEQIDSTRPQSVLVSSSITNFGNVGSAEIINEIGSSENVSVYLPQGAQIDSLPEELNDKTTLHALEQYLKLRIPSIDTVYVNAASFTGGFYAGAQARIASVRKLLDQYGYKETKISAWLETTSQQAGTSPIILENPNAVYGESFLDPMNPEYLEYYLGKVIELAKDENVDRISFDDQSWGILVPELREAEIDKGLTEEQVADLVTGGFIELINAAIDAGKQVVYSANGPFAAERITKQGIKVYEMIEGGLKHLEVQAYRPTVEGFKLLLDEIRADFDAKPETVRKLESFDLALTQRANGQDLPPEVRVQQLQLANAFLKEIKEDFSIENVGISLWPQAYNNYITGESIRHPDDPAE